jgi:flagellar M-ring protein FliF
MFAGSIDVMRLGQMAVLGLVALVLGLFVVRPILASSSRGDAAALPGGVAGALPAPDGSFDDAAAPAIDGELEPLGGFDNLPVMGDGPDFSGMGMVDFDSPPDEDPVDRLRNLIQERKTETVEILRSWMDEDEKEKAG